MSSLNGGSLNKNPPNADRHITLGGTNWLWAVFAVMAVSTLGMIAWTFNRGKHPLPNFERNANRFVVQRRRGTRFFHNIALVILATSTVAYFSMASDLGATPITAEFSRGNTGTRQIWYVRYIQWFITFPLLLMLLLFSTGLSLSDILTTMFFAWIVVVCGLVGALTASTYKWGFFALGVAALFYIWSSLLGHGPRTHFNAGSGVRSGYVRGSGLVVFITMLYPIAWGCSEGGNVISPTREMIWYGVLDLILGPLFLYYFLFRLRSVDYGTFGFHSGKYTDGEYGQGGAGGAGPNMTSHGAGMGGGNVGAGPGVGGHEASSVV
ncbi:hypothetical protein EIP91_010077 [Steccherinum ochraceum]|uniref:Ion channel activity n=1 Tax=Steccherinum ochraceum TaxID=92696 RepID=A0A4R0R697_9APHY|nr:hypothetical protein EIP91_010077 [Steccherinum ochraceum]